MPDSARTSATTSSRPAPSDGSKTRPPEGSCRDWVRKTLEGQGIGADRIDFRDMRARRQYLEQYQEIDVVLDTLPYNGHTTSLDAFCPMGPIVVTADEFGDPHEKRLWTRVNGVVKQDGVSSDMLFRIDAIIESLSKGLTVEAGDIIATGTPDGVGFSRTPPEFLRPGDLLESEVEGIGVMRNRIVGAVVAAPVGD